MASVGIGRHTSGPVITLSTVCDIIRPGLIQLCREHDMHHADVFRDHATDCIQLVIIDSKGKKYFHPRFVTRHEIVDRSWLHLVSSRFRSCARGFAAEDQAIMTSPSFTLDEIEQAQEIVDSLR